MIQKIKLEMDMKPFDDAVFETKKEMNRTVKKMMNGTLSKVRKYLKARVQGNKQTGNLAKSFKYKSRDNFSATIWNKMFYSGFLEYGAHMVPKREKYLTFKIGDDWVKVKSATIEPKPYFNSTIEGFYSSREADEIMNDVLTKALQDIWGVTSVTP